MPYLFGDKKQIWAAAAFMMATLIGTYFITRYQMEVPFHHMRRSRFLQHAPKIRLQQQAVWFLYVVVMTFSMAVGLLTELYCQRMQRQAVEFEKKNVSKGIGIENCKKRLELLYPERYTLSFGEDRDTFTVTLTINLKP